VRGSASFAKSGASVAVLEPIFNYSRPVKQLSLRENATPLNGLAPGQYILQFNTDGASQQQPLNLTGDLEVSPGEGGKLASSVTGTLRLDGNDTHCLRCYVQLTNAVSGERFGSQVVGNGFKIEGGVRSGRYYVGLLSSDGYEASTITAAGSRMIGSQLEIPAGASVRLAITATKGLGTVDGIAFTGRQTGQSGGGAFAAE